jgi:hypothetical protein
MQSRDLWRNGVNVFSGGAEVAKARHVDSPHQVIFSENLGFLDAVQSNLSFRKHFPMFHVPNFAVEKGCNENKTKNRRKRTSYTYTPKRAVLPYCLKLSFLCFRPQRWIGTYRESSKHSFSRDVWTAQQFWRLWNRKIFSRLSNESNRNSSVFQPVT